MLFESQRRYWIHKEFDMHEESFEAHPLLLGEEDHVQYSLWYTMKGHNDAYEIRILIFLKKNIRWPRFDKYAIPVLSIHQNIVHRALSGLDKYQFLSPAFVLVFDLVVP